MQKALSFNLLVGLYEDIRISDDIIKNLNKYNSVNTRINHFIPASYYAEWTKTYPQNKNKKARLQKIPNSNISLEKFMARDYFFTDAFELSLTAVDTEKITYINHIVSHLEYIDSLLQFFSYSAKKSSSKLHFWKSVTFKQNVHIKRQEAIHKLIENPAINLIKIERYLSLFWARQEMHRTSKNNVNHSVIYFIKNLANDRVKKELAKLFLRELLFGWLFFNFIKLGNRTLPNIKDIYEHAFSPKNYSRLSTDKVDKVMNLIITLMHSKSCNSDFLGKTFYAQIMLVLSKKYLETNASQDTLVLKTKKALPICKYPLFTTIRLYKNHSKNISKKSYTLLAVKPNILIIKGPKKTISNLIRIYNYESNNDWIYDWYVEITSDWCKTQPDNIANFLKIHTPE